MNVDTAMEKSLRDHLKRTAKHSVNRELDHFPPLIMYRCLGKGDVLANASWAAMQSGRLRATELITMPRHSFGPRPVSVLSPTVLTMYSALVRQLEPSLVAPSRARGNWAEHHNFGRHGEHTHVVDLDFAACYEFIDHRGLTDELTLRSMDPPVAKMLGDLLDGISPRSRGLPQMLPASDLLADTYLSIVDRHLGRMGYEVHRYVDDFRVIARSWNEANQVIEDAAEIARALGLTLSSEKTTIRRRETVAEFELAAESFLDRYMEQAGVEEDVDGRRDPYDPGSDDTDEVESAVAEAYVAVLADWHQMFTRSQGRPDLPPGMAANLGAAIKGAGAASARLPDALLTDLVFDDPLRVEVVCSYIEDRSVAGLLDNRLEEEGHWASLGQLTTMGRQSPWAKLWLLDSASRLLSAEVAGPAPEVLEWIDEQARSPFETVRSEAAWALALQGKLDQTQVKDLYARATDVTAAGIAAALARQGDLPPAVVNAIRHDSPLNELACEWAEA